MIDAVFRFFVENETPLYLVLGLGALLALRSTLSAWLGWRNAVFSLEKEMALGRLRSAGVVLSLLLMLLLMVFCMVSFVAPFLPSDVFQPTATASVSGTFPAPAASPQATISPLATPEGTVGCVPSQLMITSLSARQELSGRVILIGTADIPNFGFYKYEFAPYGSDLWTTIQAGSEIKKNQELGVWDVRELTPGDYQIRLIVIDNQDQEYPPCIIPIRVVPEQ